MLVEKLREYPTIMGLPLSFNTTLAMVVRAMVNTTFVATPSLQDVTHTELIAKVDVTPE